MQTLQDKWRKILKSYVLLPYRWNTKPHMHMFFFQHEENISLKPGLNGFRVNYPGRIVPRETGFGENRSTERGRELKAHH